MTTTAFHIFHKWNSWVNTGESKWFRYWGLMGSAVSEELEQQRSCSVCRKHQFRWVAK